ncbi:MAG: hypothetical protein M1830_006682 [Pleopsidium flavum]|nr:MAG: hypothetical protein M1830_006682 [Pleopsidium flavum]
MAMQPSRPSRAKPPSDRPVIANFDSSHLTIGAGVAIFHLASSRVVLCWHSTKEYWFLPKGRRDASEDTGAAAEREGFEESGYRNRLLPVSLKHRQPQAHNPSGDFVSPFVTEPIWTQLVPMTATSQYILFWYIAETVPPGIETMLNEQMKAASSSFSESPYQYPPKYPQDLTLAARLDMEAAIYEPMHHANTGVDSEEALYESYLLPVDEAIKNLKGTIQEDVVRSGWEAIRLRQTTES